MSAHQQRSMGSIHPSLKGILDVPDMTPPQPRAGSRPTGPSRLRRIPGPPPPKSWLEQSQHAPTKTPTESHAGDRRMYRQTSNLPGAYFPAPTSFMHAVLKKIAQNWNWHVQYDKAYLATLPIHIKENLLSYIAVYNEEPSVSSLPIRLLFAESTDDNGQGEEKSGKSGDVAELVRMDLSNTIGRWTTMRQIHTELRRKSTSSRGSALLVPSRKPGDLGDRDALVSVPDSWEDAVDDRRRSLSGNLSNLQISSPAKFRWQGLKHLSLAIDPSTPASQVGTMASWTSLLSLATELSTLTSLSLAYWPQPTYTPLAASTFRSVRNPLSNSIPGVSYGGSDMYTSLDGDFREAAGILKTLSRSLYCLTWLDLTGCLPWAPALTFDEHRGVQRDPSPQLSEVGKLMYEEHTGPDWTGSWRGIEYVGLGVGWTVIAVENLAGPLVEARAEPLPVKRAFPPTLGLSRESTDEPWDVEEERRKYFYERDVSQRESLCKVARKIADRITEMRRAAKGKKIEFDFGEHFKEPEEDTHWRFWSRLG